MQMARRDLGVETGLFLRGEGIQRPPDSLYILLNRFTIVSVASLKYDMFQKMRGTFNLDRFIPAADSDPHADRGTVPVGHRLGYDAQSVCKFFNLIHI